MSFEVDAASLAFVELQYERWAADPSAVGEQWRALFEAEGNAAPPRLGPSFAPPSLFDPDRERTSERAAPATNRLALLAAASLFRGMPDDELAEVAKIMHERVVSDGTTIFRTGEVGEAMFVIAAGTILIQRDRKVIAELGPGDVFGELAVLDDEPRSADAVAHGEGSLLVLAGPALRDLLAARPALARGMIRVLSTRLRHSNERQDAVDQLIRAYRVRGHLLADLSPLGPSGEPNPELDPAFYGFDEDDLRMTFSSRTIPGTSYMSLAEILGHLRKVYCGSIGVQYMHIDDLAIKTWITEQVEGPGHGRRLTRGEQIRILTKLTDAEIFEQFIHRKFLGAKRFSLEGGESLIPLLDLAIDRAAEHGVEEVVIGMAHRGRLNVLANVLDKSPRQIFREFDDKKAEQMLGSGDVKYHLGYSHDRKTSSGRDIHLTLTFNPSHLECVGPVVLGRVRAKQDRAEDGDRGRRMGIVIHGDAAFAGQGVVQEMLNMSELGGYRTGGTVHIIVNNQIGFTTPPEAARSTRYCTDVARMLQVPILHVNGEHPEAVARVIEIALDFRHAFKKDVVIDMYCYRRYGHNEADEPTYTQPLLYKRIAARKSVREGYLDGLLALGDVSRKDADLIEVARREHLERELSAARSPGYEPLEAEAGGGVWSAYAGRAAPVDVDTGVPRERLRALLEAQLVLPAGFTANKKLGRFFEGRAEMARGERALDWSAGEALAFASLLDEGVRVRLSGQDAGRGTFSHRHAVLFDFEDGRKHIPLQHLRPGQGRFEVRDSPLSEVAVLGFEYGYSLDTPDGLTIWEAQFGDFANVAQHIIDQFITSGEDKWKRMSGLALFLPHGYEGQGPEHSSARLERFLMLSAEQNIRVVNPSTPAQLFHVLRRQHHLAARKPLVVMSPKSLLRLPEAVSPLEDFASGRFEPVLADVGVDPSRCRRVLLSSGKLVYELLAARGQRGVEDVGLLRLEQYYPLRLDRLEAALAAYPADAELCWVQEEPRNMGAFTSLYVSTEGRIAGRPWRCIARPPSASPATGSAGAHRIEQERLIAQAFEAGA